MAFTMNRSKAEALLRAEDPDTSGADLVTLAASRDGAVKAAVAARPDCPMASMFALAQDDEPRVLNALLDNDAVPDSLIVHLAQHRRRAIREVAHKRLNTED
jgi:hypothetical protein